MYPDFAGFAAATVAATGCGVASSHLGLKQKDRNCALAELAKKHSMIVIAMVRITAPLFARKAILE